MLEFHLYFLICCDLSAYTIMDLGFVMTFLLLLACCVVCVETANRFEYCLYFRGSCELSCSPGTFAAFGTTWCSKGKRCCIQLITAAPTFTTAESRTTATSTTTPSTAAASSFATTPSLPTCGVDLSRPKFPSGRVVGGVEAERCELPWMVYISLPSGPCGGALIDDRHVLTAAHCFRALGSYTPQLVIGEYNRSESRPREKFTTTNYKIITHPDYIHESYYNDIAILRLTTPVSYNFYRCIRPVCLPSAQRRFPHGINCTVAGWGVTQPFYDVSNPPTAPVLLKVTVSVVNEFLCQRKFGRYYNRATEICAGYLAGGRDSCDGDSGGPLMCLSGTGNEVYVAGIVSSGSDCAQPQTPAIYTNVISFLPWIHKILGAD